MHMNGSEIGLTVVASVLGVIATILTILNFFKNNTKDKAAETKEMAEVQSDLHYIKSTVTKMEGMLQNQTDKQHGLELRLQKTDDKIDSLAQRETQVEHKINDIDVRLLAVEKKRANLKKGANV